MIKIIDISNHQGSFNWDALEQACKRGEFGGAVIRAGYGGGADTEFIRNRDEARRRGIPRQFYFFAYPGRSSGRAQAEEFRNRVGGLQPGESISLDMEDEASYGRNLVASDVGWALEFCNRAKELFGVKPLVYMNSSVKGRFNWKPLVDADYGLWVANYGANNGQPNGDGPDAAPWPFWAMWQFTSKGKLAGWGGDLDISLFQGDANTFLKYGLPGSTPVNNDDMSQAERAELSQLRTFRDEVKNNKINEFRKKGSETVFEIYSIPNTGHFDFLGNDWNNVREIPADWDINPAAWESQRDALRPQLTDALTNLSTVSNELSELKKNAGKTVDEEAQSDASSQKQIAELTEQVSTLLASNQVIIQRANEMAGLNASLITQNQNLKTELNKYVAKPDVPTVTLQDLLTNLWKKLINKK